MQFKNLVISFLLAMAPAWAQQQVFPASGGAGGGGGSYSAASASYTGTSYFPAGGSLAADSVETDVQALATVAGTVSNLGVRLSNAPGTGNSLTFTFRQNAADTTLTCTISSAAQTCSDLNSGHSFQVAVNDLIDIKIVASGTPVATIVTIQWATPGQQGPSGSTGATGAGYQATSSTSIAVGTGSLTFTTQSGLAYSAGARVRATSTGTGAYVEGLVTSYSGTSLTLTSDTTSGSGSHTDWNLNLAGNPGQAGSAGSQGAQGNQGASGAGYQATSSTSIAVGTGSLTFTTQSGLAYSAGARVRATSTGTGAYVEGLVTSYSGTSLTLTCDTTSGSGSHTDWNLNLAGNPGQTGATGSQGSTGSAGAAGPGYAATSSTSISVGTGSLTFTTQSGLAYSAGARVRATSRGSGAYVEGLVTSYSGTSLVMTADTTNGSGVDSDWNINVSGNVGPAGPTGPSGSGSGDMLKSTYDAANVAGQLLKDSGSNGIAARTAAGIVTSRTITGSSTISVSNGDGVSGNPILSIPSNAVGSTQTAVVNTRRTICLAFGANNAASALADADLGPQSRQYFVDAAWTLVEMEVAADAGTPQIILGRSHAGTVSNVVSSALATASSGGIACASVAGGSGIDAVTSCSSTLQNTSFVAGDWITAVSGTAGGTAKEMTACLTFTVN